MEADGIDSISSWHGEGEMLFPPVLMFPGFSFHVTQQNLYVIFTWWNELMLRAGKSFFLSWGLVLKHPSLQ